MPVSLYISLFAAGEAVLSEPCNLLQPKVGLRVRLCFPRACSSMSTPELWSCPLLKELACMHVRASVPLCVCQREEGEWCKRGELWSCWSVTDALHLFVITSEARSQVQVRAKGEQRGTVCVFQLRFYFTLLPASISATMLNILLSALIDPDRRLRSFRRSERLASILVCIIFRLLLCLFIRHMFVCVFHLAVKALVGQTNKLDDAEYWFCPRCGLAAVLHSLPMLFLVWPGLFWRSYSCMRPPDMSALYDRWYFSLAGLPPRTTYSALIPPRHAEEIAIRGTGRRKSDFLVCLEKMGRVDRAIRS